MSEAELLAPSIDPKTGKLAVRTVHARNNGGTKTEVKVRHFDIVCTDEPDTLGGTNTAPSPLETVLVARVERGLDRLFDDRCWTTTLIVAHDPVNRYLIASSLGLGLAGLQFFEQDAACVNIIDFVDDADGAVEPIIRLVNGTAGDLTRSISREPALARFYRNYLASRRAR